MFTMCVITSQLQASYNVKVDMKMSTLKPKVCEWLFTAWTHLTSKLDMVRKGWSHTALLRAFDTEFQKQAMVNNMKTPLFNNIEVDTTLETNNQEDGETCGEVS